MLREVGGLVLVALVLLAERSQAGSVQVCDGCTFYASEAGLLLREGSCATCRGKLDLSSLGIRRVDVGIFDGLSSLEQLSLSHNRLSTLPAEIFDGLSSLRNLSLSHNQIMRLSARIFNKLLSLKALDLSSNQLTCLPPDAFTLLSELVYLNIEHNNLTCVCNSWPTTVTMGQEINRCPSNFTCQVTEWLDKSSSSRKLLEAVSSSTPVQSSSSSTPVQSSSSSTPITFSSSSTPTEFSPSSTPLPSSDSNKLSESSISSTPSESSSSSTPTESSSSSTPIGSTFSSQEILTSTPLPSLCGNGILNIGETCDDGNTVSGDGCSATCTIEPFWSCSIPTSSLLSSTPMWEEPSLNSSTALGDTNVTSTPAQLSSQTPSPGLEHQTSRSVCYLLTHPRWTALSVLSSTNRMKIQTSLTVVLSSNFDLWVGSNVSILGMSNLTIGSTSGPGSVTNVSVTGSDVAADASWWADEGRLTVTVVNQVNTTSFSLLATNPSHSRSAIPLGAECRDCVSYARRYRVYDRNLTYALETVYVPPAACAPVNGEARFGSNCQYVCHGVPSGDFCLCNEGQFGFGCSQSLGAPTFKKTGTIPAGQAFTLTGTDGFAIRFPPGLFKLDQAISVSVYNSSNLVLSSPSGVSFTPLGPVILFSPAGLKFEKAVNISIPYDPAKIPSGYLAAVYYFNATNPDPWEKQTSSENAADKLIEADIYHFSGYTPLGAPAPTTSESKSSGASSSTPGPPSYPASSAKDFNVRATIQSPMTSQAVATASSNIRNAIAMGLKVNVADVSSPVSLGYTRRSNQTSTYTAELRVNSPSDFVKAAEANAAETLSQLNAALTRYGVTNATFIRLEVISSGLSAGAIAGIVVGTVAGSALLAALAYFAYKRTRQPHDDQIRDPMLSNPGVATVCVSDSSVPPQPAAQSSVEPEIWST